jgi:hypothetical protein
MYMNEKEAYVKPEAEIIEFVFEDSIAESAGGILNEDIWV